MADESRQGSGVQELIERIRDAGVEEGEQRAAQIVAEARREAAQLVEAAHIEAAQTRRQASEEIEAFHVSALEALKLAARDTRLKLEAEVLASFEQHVKSLVKPVTYDGEFIRALLLELAGQTTERYTRDKKLQVLVSDLLEGREDENEELDGVIRESVLGLSSNMFREGVEIIPSSEVPGGARVRVVDEELEIDLTDEAIGKLLLKHLLPRYRAILEGAG